jgi:regulator of sigma E protease
MPNAPDAYVPNPNLISYAVRRGFEETGRVIRFISTGLLRIVQGRVSLSSVSGPITMYDIAGQAGAKGTMNFVLAMAIISVNLGLINLLPIPVLDGGHLFFLFVEAVRRRPLSLRVREVASLIGMGLLVLLMVVAFKNDLQRRYWDVIVAQVRELFA